MREGGTDDFTFQRRVPRLYALSASEEKEIAGKVYRYLSNLPTTKSRKNAWQREKLLRLTEWATK
jgi:hypothetical protein